MHVHHRITRALVGLAVLTAALVVLWPGTVAAATKPTVFKISVVKGRPVGGVKRPTVKKGTVVRFVVTADKGTELHLHGYDIEKAMKPPKPTVIQVVAKIPGRFELEMHSPDALLAQLTVKP